MIVQSGPHVQTIITLEKHKANDIKLAVVKLQCDYCF